MTLVHDTKHNVANNSADIIFILVETIDEATSFLSGVVFPYPVYVIIIGQETKIIDINKYGFYIESKSEELFENIFACFLQRPLVISLRNCVKSIHGGNLIKKELARILTTEPICNVTFESKIEIGRSVKIVVSLDPDIGMMPNLVFKVTNQNIASCDGLYIYGLNEGDSVFEVYKKGSSKPFFTKKISVFKRNRIRKLIFSDDTLLMGVGDEKYLGLVNK